MLDEPQVLYSTGQLAAVIRINIAREEMPRIMGPSIGELMGVLAAQGIPSAGPLFAHHLWMAPGTFQFELGVPVARPVTATGRVEPGRLPAATVARTVYHGSYEGLGPAWEEFDAWIEAHGHAPALDLWECYVTGPESGRDPAGWRTELNRPLTAVGPTRPT